VIQKFLVIGEASKKIPESLKEQYPDVPWQRMAGMRDRLIHAYFGMDAHNPAQGLASLIRVGMAVAPG